MLPAADGSIIPAPMFNASFFSAGFDHASGVAACFELNYGPMTGEKLQKNRLGTAENGQSTPVDSDSVIELWLVRRGFRDD